MIGIACTASDLNRCDLGLTVLAAAVRRGVAAAGGLPVAFPVMSLSEDLMKPTAMMYRNLLAIEVEETIRSQPLDGVVALGNCDKTVPAYLMALASADIPALIVTGGFRRPASFHGERLGSGTALWRMYDERRAGRVSDADWAGLETCLGAGLGACNTMGTASTMAIMAEALGMTLPGAAVFESGDVAAEDRAEAAGRRIVSMVAAGTRPSSLLTPAGFERAMTVLAAVGGSTNAIIHLCAVAGRRGITLPLERFGQIAARVPVIADIAPIGTGLMDDLAKAGGVPAVLAAIGGAARGGRRFWRRGGRRGRFWRRGGRGRGSVAASAGFRSGDDRARVHGGAGEPGARRRGAQGGRGQPGAAATHRSGGGVPLLCRDAAADG